MTSALPCFSLSAETTPTVTVDDVRVRHRKPGVNLRAQASEQQRRWPHAKTSAARKNFHLSRDQRSLTPHALVRASTAAALAPSLTLMKILTLTIDDFDVSTFIKRAPHGCGIDTSNVAIVAMPSYRG